MTINLITLGCSKNLVDSEKLLYQLRKSGHEVYHNAETYTDGIIINTCAFILDAKTESIETILEYTRAKKEGLIEKIAVMGCLSERYRESLKAEIPEVDAFFGVSEFKEITGFFDGKYYEGQLFKRIVSTPSHYTYLKISEGCSRKCAFCAIPSIRGKQVSLPIDHLLKEAQELAAGGAKELILIAQELSNYGLDIYKKKALPELLEELVKIDAFQWIRLHYIYPDNFPTDEIIELMVKHPKICKYLDIPVQHASDHVLRRMRRGHSRKDVEQIVARFREAIPEIAVRTTVITGFPGETQQEYQELKDFVKKMQFDRLGVFAYSHEEGTPANEMKDDVTDRVKNERMDEILHIQEKISLQHNIEKKKKNFKVLIDRKEGEFYVGRTEFDSPEVDNEVLIPAEGEELRRGEFYEVEIFDAIEFDLFGRVR